MSNPVLLKGLTVDDCQLQRPHTRHHIQYDSIPPEVMIKNILAVLLVAEGCGKPNIIVRYAVGLSQVSLFMQHYPLPIIN